MQATHSVGQNWNGGQPEKYYQEHYPSPVASSTEPGIEGGEECRYPRQCPQQEETGCQSRLTQHIAAARR